MFMQRRPRSQIVPSKVRGQAVDVPVLLSLGRTRLKHSVVDADVLALWIQFLQSTRESVRTILGRDLFEKSCGFRQMFPQGIGERLRAPQEHSAVPEVVSRGDKLGSRLCIWLFREAPDVQRVALVQRARF